MIREITAYPTKVSLEFGANVRHFDEELVTLIQDLKDTINANSLNALAAFQIQSPYSVMVIKKDDGEFLEIINPRIIQREGSIEPVEKTAYFPGLSAQTKRYKKIKVMYEDRGGNQQFLTADGELSITIQRKLDYLYGSSFITRLSEEERKVFDSKLEFGTDSITNNDCPTVFKKDRLMHVIKFVFVVALLSLFAKFFLSEDSALILKTVEEYAMITMFALTVFYFFYAQYEAKQYKNCSSCQIGNIIGVTFITFVKLLVLFLANYFVF